MAGWSGGVFTRARNWVSDHSGAINPQDTLFDQEDNNFAAGLNNCVTKDGTNKPSAAMDWNGQNLTNIASLGYTGNAVGRGVAFCKFKSADTARVSTIVPANDPDLIYAIPAAGTYAFEVLLSCIQSNGTNAAGFNWNVNYSGTITAASVLAHQGFFTGSGALSLANFPIAAAVATVQGSANSASAVVNSVLLIKGVLKCTTTGNIAFSWSQANSFAGTASTIQQGSYLTVTQLS